MNSHDEPNPLEAPTRPVKFQIHFSTAIVLMIVLGGLMGINIWVFKHTEILITASPKDEMVREMASTGRVITIAVSLAILLLTWGICEWWIRK